MEGPMRAAASVALQCRPSRRRRLILPATVAAASLAGAARAQPPLAVQVNRALAVGVSAAYMDYGEFTGSPGKLQDRDTGWTPGFTLGASDIESLGGAHALFGRLDYRFSRGPAEHWSLSLLGGAPLDYTTAQTVHDVDAELGYPVAALNRRLLLIPLVQAEYRRWSRDLPQSLFDTRETYSTFAPGIGLRASYAVRPRLAASAKLGLEYTVGPRDDGAGNPANATPPTIYRLGQRPLYEAGAGLDYLLGPRLSLRLSSDYTHLDFGRSQFVPLSPTAYRYEPRSATDQVTTTLGLAWLF
jgi:hypothetical protein